MTTIDFKTSGYFSGIFIFLGFFLLFVGLMLLSINLIAVILLWFISLLIFTTHYRLSINLKDKTYHDYIWILGFRKGEKGKFDSIDYAFIKNNHVTQTMNHKSISNTIRKEVFDGYLKISGQENIHMLTLDSKVAVVKKLKNIATQLNIKIVDYSDGPPKEVG